MTRNKLVFGISFLIAIFAAPQMVAKAAPPAVAKTKYSPIAVEKGAKLFKELKCSSCHAIDDKGGCLAPELNGVTERRDEGYLLLRLSSASGDEQRFIKRIGHPELVPHPRFPKAQVKLLIAYLSTLKPQKQ